MSHAFVNKAFAAGAGLLAVIAAAPIALADPPGYYFQDWDQRPPVNASDRIARAAPEPQIEAANRKADQALTIAQQALREAQQSTQKRTR